MQIILNYAADCALPAVSLHLNRSNKYELTHHNLDIQKPSTVSIWGSGYWLQCGLWTFQNFCLEAVITAASAGHISYRASYNHPLSISLAVGHKKKQSVVNTWSECQNQEAQIQISFCKILSLLPGCYFLWPRACK